jgi:hypothetical protein
MNFTNKYVLGSIGVGIAVSAILMLGPPATGQRGQAGQNTFDREIASNMTTLFEQGKQIFRFDTFGDKVFWGDTLKLHRAIVGEKLGGVGPGLSPKKALEVGLKVDAEAIPPSLAADIKAGKVDLDDPATTVALLKLNAVVGVKAFLNEKGSARSVGIHAHCATRPLTIHLLPASGTAWMDGPIGI